MHEEEKREEKEERYNENPLYPQHESTPWNKWNIFGRIKYVHR